MLRSVQNLQNVRVLSSEGTRCGLVKDLFFDDRTWDLRYVIVALDPRQFGPWQVLVTPEDVCFGDPAGLLLPGFSATEVAQLPPLESVSPVCRQYAQMAMSSPGSNRFGHYARGSDPHLRSARTVATYHFFLGDEPAGRLADLLFDDRSGTIRHLAVERTIDGRKLLFHILPQAVERITWTTQRIVLRELLPVELEEQPFLVFPAATAA